MKSINILSLLFTCLLSSTVFAQNTGRYEKAMASAITELHAAKELEQLQQVANKLERISQAEQGEWLPGYYLGYTYLQMAAKSNSGSNDRYLEMSQQQLDKLLEKEPANSEVFALQGYKHMLYVAADPANRGADYTPRTMEAFQRAIALDPNNPRAFLLMGQMQYGVANFFGSSTEEACQLMQRGIQLIEQEKEDSLLPRWGKGMAEASARMCAKGEAKAE